MASRPKVIALDVIETLFSLDPIRRRLVDAGQPAHVLDVWFSRLLRDAFATVASGGYQPFPDVAKSSLRTTIGYALDDEAVGALLAGFAELDPHPDVVPGIRLAHDAGVRLVTLTNGSSQNTRRLLARAGVEDQIEQVLSVDDIKRWKPAPDIYLHAAASTGVRPDEVALVAAHAWDTHGAHEAGLTTGWISRLESEYPPIFAAPDSSAATWPT